MNVSALTPQAMGLAPLRKADDPKPHTADGAINDAASRPRHAAGMRKVPNPLQTSFLRKNRDSNQATGHVDASGRLLCPDDAPFLLTNCGKFLSAEELAKGNYVVAKYRHDISGSRPDSAIIVRKETDDSGEVHYVVPDFAQPRPALDIETGETVILYPPLHAVHALKTPIGQDTIEDAIVVINKVDFDLANKPGLRGGGRKYVPCPQNSGYDWVDEKGRRYDNPGTGLRQQAAKAVYYTTNYARRFAEGALGLASDGKAGYAQGAIARELAGAAYQGARYAQENPQSNWFDAAMAAGGNYWGEQHRIPAGESSHQAQQSIQLNYCHGPYCESASGHWYMADDRGNRLWADENGRYTRSEPLYTVEEPDFSTQQSGDDPAITDHTIHWSASNNRAFKMIRDYDRSVLWARRYEGRSGNYTLQLHPAD